MSEKRLWRLAVLVAIVGILAHFSLTATVHAGIDVPEPQPMTVYVYENKNGWLPDGDVLRTGPGLPSVIHRWNLVGTTTGLHGGCSRTFPIPPSGDWNDCISAVYIPGMPTGYRLELYNNENYSGLLFCFDTSGYFNLGGIGNDSIQSFHVLSGTC